MVIGNAYKPGHTFLFDHIHRRDHQSEAIEEYDAGLLSCHEEFTNDIAASMTAKVEIIYGAKVQRRLLLTQDFDVLPLWGDFEGIVFILAHEKDYSNRKTQFRLCRVMLMACQPQLTAGVFGAKKELSFTTEPTSSLIRSRGGPSALHLSAWSAPELANVARKNSIRSVEDLLRHASFRSTLLFRLYTPRF